MVPSDFVLLDHLPLTPNGKVDRSALPEPVRLSARAGDAFVGPTNAIERQMAEIWKEVLGLERVSIHDSFFELGGHSLTATRLISRARNLFGIELPIRSVFESPTLAELARIVATAIREGTHTTVPTIVPLARRRQQGSTDGEGR